jgi:mono/diheme cytochrome c family protein
MGRNRFAAIAACAGVAASAWAASADPQIERGRYIVLISGCNDCHTPQFPQTGGQVPESEWLRGDRLGWHGPWGTTFAPNLRIYMRDRSEDEWVKAARSLKARPPMPWWALHVMNESDLRALYRFVRSLGDAGAPAPQFMPPGKAPAPPYVDFVLRPPAKPAK